MSPDRATDTEVNSFPGMHGSLSMPGIIPRGGCAFQEATVTPAQPEAKSATAAHGVGLLETL